MARTARLYIPISVGFFNDLAVVRAGERAGWLLLSMLAEIKTLDQDGSIHGDQIARLNIRDWRPRLNALIEQQLVTQVGDGEYQVPSWAKWNELTADRQVRLQRDRDRKTNGKPTDSARIPDGTPADSALKEGRKEEGKEGSRRNLSSPSIGTSPKRATGVDGW